MQTIVCLRLKPLESFSEALGGIDTPLSGIRVKNARSAPVGLVLDADVATHAI